MTNEQFQYLIRIHELIDSGQIWKAKILLEEILGIDTMKSTKESN